MGRLMLARMLVSGLPLLRELDLGIVRDLDRPRGLSCTVTVAAQDAEGYEAARHRWWRPRRQTQNPAATTTTSTTTTTTSLIDVLVGKFSAGLSSLSLAGRRGLAPMQVRKLALFEAASLVSLDLSHCALLSGGGGGGGGGGGNSTGDAELVCQALGTCVRLVRLNLCGAFAMSEPGEMLLLTGAAQRGGIGPAQMHTLSRRLRRLEALDIRRTPVTRTSLAVANQQDQEHNGVDEIKGEHNNENEEEDAESLCLNTVLVNCPALHTLRTDWRPSDRSLALLSQRPCHVSRLDLCLSNRAVARADGGGGRCRQQPRRGMHRPHGATPAGYAKLNQPRQIEAKEVEDESAVDDTSSWAESLVALRLGGLAGAPGAIADGTLSVTLSLATGLRVLHLRGCARVTGAAFSRLGEGRGIVAVFVAKRTSTRRRAKENDDSNTHVNTVLARIDSLPRAVRDRLVGGPRLRRGETYEYRLPQQLEATVDGPAASTASNSNGSGRDWQQWSAVDSGAMTQKQKRKLMRRRRRAAYEPPAAGVIGEHILAATGGKRGNDRHYIIGSIGASCLPGQSFPNVCANCHHKKELTDSDAAAGTDAEEQQRRHEQVAADAASELSAGYVASAPPSGTFESSATLLQSLQWRARAAAVPLLDVALVQLPLVEDGAVRTLLSRTPCLQRLRLVGLIQIVDPFSATGSHFAVGEDTNVAAALRSLRELELSDMGGCRASAGEALCAAVQENCSRQRRQPLLWRLRLEGLPMWPSVVLARILQSPAMRMLRELDVKRMSFDDRCLEALMTRASPRLCTLRLSELPVETRPRMSPAALATYVQRMTTLTQLEGPGFGDDGAEGGGNEGNAGLDAGEIESLEARQAARLIEEDRRHVCELRGEEYVPPEPQYVHYSKFRRHLKGRRLPLRLSCGDVADLCAVGGHVLVGEGAEGQGKNDNDHDHDDVLRNSHGEALPGVELQPSLHQSQFLASKNGGGGGNGGRPLGGSAAHLKLLKAKQRRRRRREVLDKANSLARRDAEAKAEAARQREAEGQTLMRKGGQARARRHRKQVKN